MDHIYYICFVFVLFSCLFIAALWSPAGKGMTSWLSCIFKPSGISHYHQLDQAISVLRAVRLYL